MSAPDASYWPLKWTDDTTARFMIGANFWAYVEMRYVFNWSITPPNEVYYRIYFTARRYKATPNMFKIRRYIDVLAGPREDRLLLRCKLLEMREQLIADPSKLINPQE
jgi:hypothetical protein